ncbi:hypothetical protein B0H10DRAFT_2227657 [Mycena sp. CBHHK59/15]|nr:hypothetical protein B0H10DRAFT_2227657 [Mycena sp. CBHHK59/15]
MPAATRRPQRAESLMKPYIRHNKGRQRRALLRRRAAARARRENPGLRKARFDTNLDVDSDTSSESSTDSSGTSSDAKASFASAAATAPAAWALAETMAALFVVFGIVDMNNRRTVVEPPPAEVQQTVLIFEAVFEF